MPKYSPDFFTSIDIKTANITNSGTSGKLQIFNMGGIGRFFASPSCLKVIKLILSENDDGDFELHQKALRTFW